MNLFKSNSLVPGSTNPQPMILKLNYGCGGPLAKANNFIIIEKPKKRDVTPINEKRNEKNKQVYHWEIQYNWVAMNKKQYGYQKHENFQQNKLRECTMPNTQQL